MAHKFYRKVVDFSSKYPVITLTLTNIGLAAIADTVAQTVPKIDGDFNINSEEPFDTARFSRFLLYQGAFAPICYKWYSFLDKRIPILKSSILPTIKDNIVKVSSFQSLYKPVLKRVLADQLLFAPVGLAAFYSAMTLMEGGGISGVQTKLKEVYYQTMLTNWSVWPIVQFVNFCYVPLFFRLPFASVVGIFWNTYLSFMNSKIQPTQNLSSKN